MDSKKLFLFFFSHKTYFVGLTWSYNDNTMFEFALGRQHIPGLMTLSHG